MFAAEKRAKFVASTHSYFIDGVKIETSVTRVVSNAFAPFDADAVIAKNLKTWRRCGKYKHLCGTDKQVTASIKALWANAGVLGTAMHQWIELYLAGLDQPPDSPETDQFKKWWDAEKKNALRTELIVWWKNKNDKIVCAGQIDAIIDDFVLLDWKRVEKNLSPTERVYKYGALGIPDTKYHRYSLQLSMYWLMIEQTYGIVPPTCMIVSLFGDRTPEPMVIHDYKKEARLLLEALV